MIIVRRYGVSTENHHSRARGVRRLGDFPIAVDTGFFKLADNTLLLLTEAAIDVQSTDEASIDAAVQRAQEALEKAKHEKQVDEEELERLDKMLRFSIAQKLTKQAKRS